MSEPNVPLASPPPNADQKGRELDLREREVAAREREIAAKEAAINKSPWRNPLVIGLFVAALGLIGNATAADGMRTQPSVLGIGAIPAMVFLGMFMVRFYDANAIRSVPEYLRMRFDQ